VVAVYIDQRRQLELMSESQIDPNENQKRGGNVAIYLSSSYRVQSSSRILSACGWYLLTVARGPMTITRHPCTGSGITFIAAALMPIVVATISASSDAVFFSTASASKFFIVSQSSGTHYRPSGRTDRS
jgi:hypothetical protein